MAWECGGGWGHVGRMVPLARAFRDRGWRVTLVLKDLSQARRWFGADDATLVQAPRIPIDPELVLPTLNASSLLSEAGWLDARALCRLLREWQRILAELRPSLLLCDYAPAAFLAGRQLPAMASFNVGSEFGAFIVDDPMPPLRWWDAADARVLDECRAHDDLVRSVVNRALRALRWPQLRRIGELWPADTTVLCSVPPLDHGARHGRPRRCWGSVGNSVSGVRPPDWPTAGREKVFAYLKPVGEFEGILQALVSLGLCCLVVVPGATADLVARFGSDRLRFSPPVDIPAALTQASLVVCNGTHSVCAQSLSAGVPLLMNTYALEQRLNAVAVEEVGAGLRVSRQASVDEIATQIRRLLDEPSFRQAAQALAASDWARKTSADVAEAVAEHCIGSVASVPSGSPGRLPVSV